MTHLEAFVANLRSSPGAKTIALLAAISFPVPTNAETLSRDASSETLLTQQAEESAAVPVIADPSTELKVKTFQSEADDLARDTVLFLESLRSNPAYAKIYAQQTSPVEKLELIQRQLNADLNTFNLTTNKSYANLALFNDARKTAALKAEPGFSKRVDRISETVLSVREVLMTFRESTTTGANRADQLMVLENNIRLAQLKLGSALLAIRERYEMSPSPSNPAPPLSNSNETHKKNGFNI